MKHSIAQALLIASVFWAAAIVVAVADDDARPQPLTAQHAPSAPPAPAVVPEVSSAQDGSREPRAQRRDDGGNVDEPVPAEVEPARTDPSVASQAPQRATGPDSTSRGSSSTDDNAAAPRSQRGTEGTTPTRQTGRQREQDPPAAKDPPSAIKPDPPAPKEPPARRTEPDPPAAKEPPPTVKPDSPVAKPKPPAEKPEPPTAKADPPAAVKSEPPAAKAQPPGKAKPPAAKPDHPAPKSEPPAPKSEPPAAKAEPPAAKADPPAAKADPPAAKKTDLPPGQAKRLERQVGSDETSQGSD